MNGTGHRLTSFNSMMEVKCQHILTASVPWKSAVTIYTCHVNSATKLPRDEYFHVVMSRKQAYLANKPPPSSDATLFDAVVLSTMTI